MSKNVVFSSKVASVISLLCLTTACSPVVTSTDISYSNPESKVRQVYASFGNVLCDKINMSSFFQETFVKELIRACDADLFLYTGNPVIPGNDFDDREITSTLKINCQQRDTTVCAATFDSFGESYTVRFYLTEETGNWVITDIVDYQGDSFRSALAQLLN